MKSRLLLVLFGVASFLVACGKKNATAPEHQSAVGPEYPIFYHDKATPAIVLSPAGPLNIQPALGRNFTVEDFRPDAPPVAMLGYEFWVEATGRSPQAIGAKIRFMSVEFTIVGIAPAKTGETADRVVWVYKRG